MLGSRTSEKLRPCPKSSRTHRTAQRAIERSPSFAPKSAERKASESLEACYNEDAMKHQIGDKVELNGMTLRIVAIDSFGPYKHYGVQIISGTENAETGWILTTILDAMS